MPSAADNPIPSPAPGLTWVDDCTAHVNKLLRELDHEGWDTYQACPLDRQTVELALKAAAEIAEKVPGCPQPSTVPTIFGGIDHEWWEPRHETNIELNPDGRWNVYNYKKHGPDDELAGTETETETEFTDYGEAVSAAVDLLKARYG